ncbi:MAG: hypothetical protein HYR58_06375, partial [Acidobacteria bacterium]|nr:hypothetical protein [Acidobacteriota bacterium]
NRARFFEALIDFQKRDRRFGGLSAAPAEENLPQAIGASAHGRARH